MKIQSLPENAAFAVGKNVPEAYKKLQKLITSLDSHTLPEDVVVEINKELEQLNTSSRTEKELLILLKKAESNILSLVRKRLGLVPERFYTFLWMPLGMAAFGLPLGTLIFAITGNVAFISLGLPIGVGMGALVGTIFDKKANQENKVI